MKVEFNGNLKPILLEQAAEESERPDTAVSISLVNLTEDTPEASEDELPALLRGEADLILKPGQTRVFEMRIPLREPGEATASAVILSHENERFSLDYTLNIRDGDAVVGWYIPGSSKPRHVRPRAHVFQIQPRPPKMEIKLAEPLGYFYANEPIALQIELLNAEEEAASVKLDVHLFGKEVPGLRIEAGDHEGAAEAAAEESKVSGLVLGSIESAAFLKMVVHLDPAQAPTTLDLHLRASYQLASDSATQIMQMLTMQLNIVNAFEANYDLVPRMHPDPWPSLFDYEGLLEDTEGQGGGVARGFAQRWCLLCHYASFAHEDVKVVGLELKVLSCVGGGRCNVVQGPSIAQGSQSVAPKTMHEAQFDLVAHKMSLDDRQPVTLDLAFVIQWQRVSRDGVVNTTTMPVGKYVVLGTEPRVLAGVRYSSGDEPSLVQLDMTVENPSSHFLTFGLTMEPSEEFAFSGSKQTTLNLLPQSRRTVTYRLLPFSRGDTCGRGSRCATSTSRRCCASFRPRG